MTVYFEWRKYDYFAIVSRFNDAITSILTDNSP